MKIVVVSLVLLTTCFAVENTTTELEQQLKVQKRDKQYLIEDDRNEVPQQKRDERQSTLNKNNNNLDPKGNSRIINIRMQPNMLTAPIKQVLKPVLQKPINGRIDTTPQIVPTKIPVILKTAKVVPGPAHALRMKILQNKINDSSLNAEKKSYPNNGAPSSTSKTKIPYFNIEDKMTRETEGRSGSVTTEDVNLLDSNVTLIKDGKESDKNALNEGNKAQVPSNTESKAIPEAVQQPVPFFIDEPEPLPQSIRKQYLSEMKEVPPRKHKEIPIVNAGNNKPKKEEFRKKMQESDDITDPDIVQISNGTHLISIEKIQNNDGYYNIDTAVLRNGDEHTALTEERIVNHAPPIPKPISDEPEKHSLGFRNKEKNVGLAGLVFNDNTIMEQKDQDVCITPTNRNYEEFEEKLPVSPTVTIQQTNPPTTFNEGTQEATWNYLQNPYNNPYYQNMYDQYRRNYGLTQTTSNMYGLAQPTQHMCGQAQPTPNICGEDTNVPKNFGAQINPICGQTNFDPNASGTQITLPYYPNGYPPFDSDSTQKPYYRNQPEVDNTIYLEGHTENSLDRIWRTWNHGEMKIRNAEIDDTDVSLDIDIRREGNKGDSVLNKMVNPYTTSSLPININGALIYPYMNPGYRYMR